MAGAAAALGRLDEIAHRLRRECPWDREQDESSIIPHTVEEAYELADAIDAADDARIADELGDVLFQVVFLSLLLEERGAGSLASVAEQVTEKLIRRHPHVFGDAEVSDSDQVRRNWDAIKATEPGRRPGLFAEVPESLPALLYARKLARRAASAGLEPPAAAEVAAEAIGETLLGLVEAARRADVDPELALRASARRWATEHDPSFPH